MRACASERRRQPAIGQQRRVDAAGQVAQVLEGRRRLVADLGEQRASPFRIALDQSVGELQLDRERDQLLLRAVVDVALQASSLVVLGLHDALLRGLQLRQPRLQVLGETHVPQHQAGLGREVDDQLLVGRRDRIAGGLRDRERAEELAALLDRVDTVGAQARRQGPVRQRDGSQRCLGLRRPDGDVA
ncbi:MAG: hypothetical protein U0V56_06065 [Actinomycetota bacterium]